MVLLLALPVASSAALPPAGHPKKFVMAAVVDGASNVWAGTEGHGLFRIPPGAKGEEDWSRFTPNDGLGDDYVYALACDQQGRIWAGHLNHGVSVFDGARWKNFDVPFGPIGERVNEIAVCPTDGDVWMGTSAGLTRYSGSSESWSHFTRRDGLPGDNIRAIAFATNGTVFVGTDCEGVAFAGPESGYRRWTRVPVADEKIPAYSGSGLPSRLINDLLVASDGKIYAATCQGLAFSGDGGKSWLYRRGKDYPVKLMNLEGGPPKGWKNPVVPEFLLPEDYVSCLAEGAGGVVWLGFRQKGVLVMDGFSQRTIFSASPKEMNGADYPRAILPDATGVAWVGTMGGGLQRVEGITALAAKAKSADRLKAGLQTRNLPSPARAPGLGELNELVREVEGVPLNTNGSRVVAMADDWRTQGQWLGRHGRFFSVLCAMWSPSDAVWGAGWDADYGVTIGNNRARSDTICRWIHWNYTADNRCLEMPPTYLHSRVVKGLSSWELDRREAEWDDHGEAYPQTKDGPHVYLTVKIPAGHFVLSLYDINPNGHNSAETRRDYAVSVRGDAGEGKPFLYVDGKFSAVRRYYDAEQFAAVPELARGRLCDFWGGVYKRFLVRGPTNLTVQINRNNSFNTILAGVMLDLADELPPPYFLTREDWEKRERTANESAADSRPPRSAATDEETAARRLGNALHEVRRRNPVWWAANKRRTYQPLLRWHLAQPQPDAAQLATAYYELDFYKEWEDLLTKQGYTTARELEKALRWDLITPDCSRMGNKFVRDYIEAHPEKFTRYEQLPGGAPAR